MADIGSGAGTAEADTADVDKIMSEFADVASPTSESGVTAETDTGGSDQEKKAGKGKEGEESSRSGAAYGSDLSSDAIMAAVEAVEAVEAVDNKAEKQSTVQATGRNNTKGAAAEAPTQQNDKTPTNTTKTDESSSSAALLPSASKAKQGTPPALEALLSQRNAQISKLQADNRELAQQVQEREAQVRQVRDEGKAELNKMEALWLVEKAELQTLIKHLEEDLETATADMQRFGTGSVLNTPARAKLEAGESAETVDEIDNLMAASTDAASTSNLVRQQEPVVDCLTVVLTRDSIYDSFGVEFLEMGHDRDDPHLVVRTTQGAAAEMGLQRLDRLLSINGEQVTSFSALSDAVGNNLRLKIRVRRPPVQLRPELIETDVKEFKTGDIVRISGLRKAVSFNQKIAKVISAKSVGGTYTIELLDSTQQLLVFPGNIDLVRDDGPRNFSGFQRNRGSIVERLTADFSRLSVVQLRKKLRELGLPTDMEKEDAVRLLIKHMQHNKETASDGAEAGVSAPATATLENKNSPPSKSSAVQGTTRAFVENASIFLSPHYHHLMTSFERRLRRPFDWINVDCSAFPAPLCRVSSPVILQLVASWSEDPDHMAQFQSWLTNVVRGQLIDPSFRWQCELSRLHIETLRGFLTVLVPLLTEQAPVPVLVYVRRTRLSPDELDASYDHEEVAKFVDLRIALNGWQQLDCFDNSVPEFGLTSPIVQDILDCWTDDRERIRRLNEWMASLMTGSSNLSARGVELVDMPLDVARGFVSVLVPILLHTAPIGINVYARRARRSLSSIGPRGIERWKWEFRNLSTVDLLNMSPETEVTSDGVAELVDQVSKAGIALDIRMELRRDI